MDAIADNQRRSTLAALLEKVMARLCNGDFSPETQQRLREKYANDPSGLFIEPCGRCSTHVVALNKSGVWIPKSHEAPRKRPLGESAGYKR
jgi:hypothetical protein